MFQTRSMNGSSNFTVSHGIEVFVISQVGDALFIRYEKKYGWVKRRRFAYDPNAVYSEQQFAREHPDIMDDISRMRVGALPGTFAFRVRTAPSDARVRIMNIKAKYYGGMSLELGKQYVVRVDRSGYEDFEKVIRYTSATDAEMPVTLKKVAPKNSVVHKSSTDRGFGEKWINPDYDSNYTMGKSPGVQSLAKKYRMGTKADRIAAAKLRTNKKIYRTFDMDSNDVIGELAVGTTIVAFNKWPGVYVAYLYRDKIQYGWMKVYPNANDMTLVTQLLSEKYTRSILGGYLSNTNPLRLRSKEYNEKFALDGNEYSRRQFDASFAAGDRPNIYYRHKSDNSLLVRLQYQGIALFKWFKEDKLLIGDVEYNANIAAGKTYQKKRLKWIAVFTFVLAFYTCVMLTFRSGSNLLSAIGEKIWTGEARYFTRIVFCISFGLILINLFGAIGYDATGYVSHPKDFVVNRFLFACYIPAFLLFPLVSYIIYLDMFVASSQVAPENTAYTTDRATASRQNDSIHDGIGDFDPDMSGMRAKAESSRMNNVSEAMRARKKAYEEFIGSAKAQREAEVETHYKGREDE